MKSFTAWRAHVDIILEQTTGLDSNGLPDMPYFDWWSDGLTALQAAKRALKISRTQPI